MKIVVAVKPVPDTTAPKSLDPQTFRLVRSAATVLNPFDEFAVEAALRVKEKNPGATVTLVSMAPESAKEAIRKAMGMGADAAYLISDASLAGADGRATSMVLAAAIKKIEADLVLTGTTSSDAGGGYIGRMLAERLGVPAMLDVRTLEVGGGVAEAERLRGGVLKKLEAPLPFLASITKEIGAVRYPSLKGIMAAKNKPLTNWTLADLGLSAADVAPAVKVLEATPRPPRANAKVVTPGSAEEAARIIMDFLIERKALSA